jgi:hypothetical protein
MLNLLQLDLSCLVEHFIEEEVLQIIHVLPSDKAQDPNGFTA